MSAEENDMEEESDQQTSSEETTESEKVSYSCTTCVAVFARKFNRDRHVARFHNNIMRAYDCRFCGAVFNSREQLTEHQLSHAPTTGFQVYASAFRRKCVIYRKTHGRTMTTLEETFAADSQELVKLIEFERDMRRSIKLSLIYHAEFTRLAPQLGEGAVNLNPQSSREDADGLENEIRHESDDEEDRPRRRTLRLYDLERRGEEGNSDRESSPRRLRYVPPSDAPDAQATFMPEGEEADGVNSPSPLPPPSPPAWDAEEQTYEICLRAPSNLVTTETNIFQILNIARRNIQNRVDDFVENGSGWRLSAILATDVELGNCAALNGSCNMLSIKHPKELSKVKPSSRLQNCFLRAVAYYYCRTDHAKTLDKFIKKHFVVKIKQPVSITGVQKFERDNSHVDFKINVIYSEERPNGRGEDIYPLYYSKRKSKNVITLLLYKTVVDHKVVTHYSFVEDVSKLLRKKYYRGGNWSYEKTFPCMNCFSKFNSESYLNKHLEYCIENKTQAVRIPIEGDVIAFTNHVNKFESFFLGVFDFESCHVKQEFECERCEKVKEDDSTACPHKTLTKAIQKPITCSYLIIDKNMSVIAHNTYTGYDCVDKLLQELIDIEPKLLAVLNRNVTLTMNNELEKRFLAAGLCHICGKTLVKNDKVRDHCHITGDYLGAAHSM